MNIFYLSHKTSRCARWHCDKHVVKMILETTQLLYTAHWVLSNNDPDLSSAPYRKNVHERGYRPIKNRNHPCAIWARASLEHYAWLCQLGLALCEEYRFRFGSSKRHSCEEHIEWLYEFWPPSLEAKGWKQPPKAMPIEYKQGDSIVAYREYYRKGKKDILAFTKRHAPHWL